jgi:hypothetical protein
MQRALIDESYEFGPYSLFKVRDPWFSYAKSANVHQVLNKADALKHVDAL